MRSAILIGLVGCSTSSAAPVATHADAASAMDASAVTRVLPDRSLRELAGCWRWDDHGQVETWTFRAKGDHGLEVVREISDASYAARARIPRDVMYDPTVGTYAFAAAGRIHALMFLFQRKADQLVADSYSSRQPGSYAPTGNTLTLQPCK